MQNGSLAAIEHKKISGFVNTRSNIMSWYSGLKVMLSFKNKMNVTTGIQDP